MTTIKERVIQLVEYKKIKKGDFFSHLNMSSSNFRGGASKTPLNSTAIVNIMTIIPDVNLEWLITGQGEMLKSALPAVTNHTTEAVTPVEQTIPVFELPKSKSLAAFFDKLPNPIEHLYIPNLPKADGAVVMRGETMRPALNGGDIAVYKTMRNRRENILFGQMYLLSFVADDEEHIVIKYIQPSEHKDNIKLVSANNYFGPLDIPFDSIQALAMIKASIRYETMS